MGSEVVLLFFIPYCSFFISDGFLALLGMTKPHLSIHSSNTI